MIRDPVPSNQQIDNALCNVIPKTGQVDINRSELLSVTVFRQGGVPEKLYDCFFQKSTSPVQEQR